MNLQLFYTFYIAIYIKYIAIYQIYRNISIFFLAREFTSSYHFFLPICLSAYLPICLSAYLLSAICRRQPRHHHVYTIQAVINR